MFKIGLIRITNFIKGTLIGANQRYVYNAIIDINPDDVLMVIITKTTVNTSTSIPSGANYYGSLRK